VRQLEQSRQGLRYILSVTPEMHRLQPLSDLLQGILLQTAGLLGVVDSYLAVLREPPRSLGVDGFLAMIQDSSRLVIRAGTGRYRDAVNPEIDDRLQHKLRELLEQGAVGTLDDAIVMSLVVGELVLGLIVLHRPAPNPDFELLRVFANQAAVAIHNTQLHQMAALDALTQVQTRRFLEHALAREVRLAHRHHHPLSLLMVDLDRMKQINDQGGHLAGDQALARVGEMLGAQTRSTDLIGRYGGDEFAVLLPATDAGGARVVADRILAAARELSVETDSGPLGLSVTVGIGILEPPAPDHGLGISQREVRWVCTSLIEAADGSLYEGKRNGRNQVGACTARRWPDPDVIRGHATADLVSR
jgi:diguanylate cyclase (GGDEF)-like protein